MVLRALAEKDVKCSSHGHVELRRSVLQRGNESTKQRLKDKPCRLISLLYCSVVYNKHETVCIGFTVPPQNFFSNHKIRRYKYLCE
jgi:hypothetical protein